MSVEKTKRAERPGSRARSPKGEGKPNPPSRLQPVTPRLGPITPNRHREIVAVARAVLQERGFGDFTMDEVAARARCSKSTLYRRWQDKADLIVSIIHDADQMRSIPDTGTLRGDLEALLTLIEQGMRERGPLFLGIAHAVHTDPAIAAAWRRHGFRDNKRILEAMVRRAVERGELTSLPNVEVLFSLIPGTVTWRIYVEQAGSLAEFACELIDHVLLPFLKSY